jgi:hypothetical protein
MSGYPTTQELAVAESHLARLPALRRCGKRADYGRLFGKLLRARGAGCIRDLRNCETGDSGLFPRKNQLDLGRY